MRKLILFSSVVLALGACKPEASSSPAVSLTGAEWVAEDIGGKGIIDNAHITIAFDSDGRASGHSGCNRYTGGYKLDGQALSFPSPMASTRMACLAEALGNQEQAYLDILSKVERAEMSDDGALILKTADGASLTFRTDSEAAPTP